MMLSTRSIQALRERPENDIWSTVAALQQMLNVLFQLEQNQSNQEVLRDLSAASIEVSKELAEILKILEGKISD